MGNYRFKLSDMMPNAWFYKLRDMGMRSSRRARKQSPAVATPNKRQQATPTRGQNPRAQPRKSHYFSRDLPHQSPAPHDLVEPPRRSSKQRTCARARRREVVSSSVSSACNCRVADESLPELSVSSTDSSMGDCSFSPELRSSPCGCRAANDRPCPNDAISSDKFVEIDLRPIVTKPAKAATAHRRARRPGAHESPAARRSPGGGGGGVRLRLNSPRIAGRRSTSGRKSVGRRSLSESFAVVKASVDPHRDFKESMVEMISENNMRTSKDLEDLLACYLSLNSDEYHDVIIKVFKQIWVDLNLIIPS